MKPVKEASFWEQLERWCQFLAKVPFAFAMLLIMVLMFLTGVDVIGRSFGKPIPGSYQMSELTQLWIICMAWPFTIDISSHVSVSFFISRRSPITKKIADILTRIIAMGVFAAIAWQGLEMVKRSYEQVELVNILDIPIYSFQLAVPIGAFISFVVLFGQLCILAAGRDVNKVEKA
jgi:TRAP-type C4-dicarboxylate transport system permease small subunit